MADDIDMAPAEQGNHVRFYGDFISALKWAVVALALLLVAMAVFLA